VLAYNALTRANRLVMAQLDGFAHDLHAFFATGARRAAVKGKTAIASAAAPAAMARQAA
jgi:biopolymer transport protein ExbB